MKKNIDINLSTCKECGAVFTQNRKGRKRKFCSAACRRKWWRKHPECCKKSVQAMYPIKCRYCGKVFISYGNKKRRFCSHSCFIRDRFWRKEDYAEFTKSILDNKKPDFVPQWLKVFLSKFANTSI